MPNVLRILDANANRAREALRVMEEAARFILNNPALSQAIKQLRHDLAQALAAVPNLEANRDTPGDVGTSIHTASETRRDSVADVVTAAGKRLSEALRAIEEYGKVLPPLTLGEGWGEGASDKSTTSFSASIEALRYRGYDIEQRLHLALASGQPGRQWKLCVLLSAELCPASDWLKVAQAVVQAACDTKSGDDLCLQLREKTLDAGDLMARARTLIELCRPLGISVIVNDRPDVALAAGADGVHVGQTDLPCREIRRLFGRQLLVGVSTSNIDEARKAIEDGADYCGVGPMFPTTTKAKPVLAGPEYLRDFIRKFPHQPHLAIGGITPGNLPELIGAGVRGNAVSSTVCSTSDPGDITRRLLAAMAQK